MNKRELGEFIKKYGVCYSHEQCRLKGKECLKCEYKSSLKVTGATLGVLCKPKGIYVNKQTVQEFFVGVSTELMNIKLNDDWGIFVFLNNKDNSLRVLAVDAENQICRILNDLWI